MKATGFSHILPTFEERREKKSHGSSGDAGDPPLSAYCSVSLQSILVLVVTAGYEVVIIVNKNKLRGFSPQASYTDRAAVACRQS
jgi:hypothetical protein